MWTTINGFDYTSYVQYDSISLSQSINDPQPKASFDLYDIGSQFNFAIGQEVVIYDENAAPIQYTGGGNILYSSLPAHNIVQLPNISGSSGGAWSSTGALSIFNSFPGLFPNAVFNNTTYTAPNNYQLLTAISPAGYVRAGQQYMFSVYANIATPLVNALGVVQMQFQDSSGTLIGSPVTTTFSSTTNNAQQRIAISAVAPANAVYLQVWFGGQATTSGTNSGTINYGTPQAEPMLFTNQGVSYPTNDCNFYQVNCAKMPDGTVSRAVRIFAGTIDDYQWAYDGPNRVWTISVAGPGALLENGLVNATYTSQYDDQILSSIISTYFSGQISIAAPNSTAASPVQRGALIDSVSYSDNTLREVCNGLVDNSGFMFYLDWYYALRYNPQYYTAANFVLTDGAEDLATSFNYYDLSIEVDGTQLKRRVKIVGGKFIAPAISDTFNGTGSQTSFTLSQQPYNVHSVTVGGTAQKTGVKGRDKLGINGIVALVDKANMTLTFQSAPASGTNNVVISYTYEAPVSVQVIDQAEQLPVTPAYAQPLYDSKVHDTNLISLNAATTRGLAELTKYSRPKSIIKLKCHQYTLPGNIIYLTHALSGITNQPFTVQTVDGAYLGNGVNEYAYQLGAYQPGLIDHIRNHSKALSRSTTTSNINAPQQIDVVSSDTIGYRDSVTATVQTQYAMGVYGTARYGQASYGGSTGPYGTARYGSSYIYG